MKLWTCLVGLSLLSVQPARSADATASISQLLVGTWALVRSEGTQADGTKTPNFGSSPKGRLVLDDAGNFTVMLMSGEGRPKFASDNRMRGTADEYTAALQGSIAYFGTYAVDEGRKTIRFHIDGSVFPNWEGIDQERTFSVSSDEMTYASAAASNGLRSENTFKRLK